MRLVAFRPVLGSGDHAMYEPCGGSTLVLPIPAGTPGCGITAGAQSLQRANRALHGIHSQGGRVSSYEEGRMRDVLRGLPWQYSMGDFFRSSRIPNSRVETLSMRWRVQHDLGQMDSDLIVVAMPPDAFLCEVLVRSVMTS